MEPYMEALNEEKEKGRIKVVGVSCHDLEALKIAVASPWVEVILARINPKGVLMDGGPDAVVPVLQQAKDNGKAIIGMKIFGAGQLSKEPEACVKYAQGLGLLDAMTIGFTKPEEVDSMLRMISQFPAKAMA
jgi:predicted aldo/keto reductase-like oxidoreductase